MIGERIKALRKVLNLTQQELADKVDVKRNTIASYEINRNEPQASVVTLICRELNVNRHWLETGEGEMFERLDRESEIINFVKSLSPNSDLDQFKLNVVSQLAKLDEKEWIVFSDFIAKLSDK